MVDKDGKRGQGSHQHAECEPPAIRANAGPRQRPTCVTTRSASPVFATCD